MTAQAAKAAAIVFAAAIVQVSILNDVTLLAGRISTTPLGMRSNVTPKRRYGSPREMSNPPAS